MSRTIQAAPIRKTLVVGATPAKAFEVFTARFDRWWPRTHYLGASPLVRATIEPGVGGRWYSTHEDGSEAPWGEVLVWEPPHRLILAWRISHEWGYVPNLLTEVEVRFTALDDVRTRVEFEHRHLDRLGDTPKVAETITSMDRGWGTILGKFKEAVEDVEQTDSITNKSRQDALSEGRYGVVKPTSTEGGAKWRARSR